MGVEGETVVLLDEVFVFGAAGDAQDQEEPCAERLRDLLRVQGVFSHNTTGRTLYSPIDIQATPRVCETR